LAKPTLEEYLKLSLENGIFDHAIRVSRNNDGLIAFHAHLNGFDGDTLDYMVKKDSIYPMHSINAEDIAITVKCGDCGKEYKVASGAEVPICHGKYMCKKVVT
jgi:hypothetical protein